MRELPADLAKEIYWRSYWIKIGGSTVAEYSQPLAKELFDTAVNMGVKDAIRFLQRSLNVLNREERDYEDITVDGIWGDETRAALDSYVKTRKQRGISVLIKMLNALQGTKYVRIAEENEDLEAFVFGWFRQRVS
jgi:lysozyme family protein